MTHQPHSISLGPLSNFHLGIFCMTTSSWHFQYNNLDREKVGGGGGKQKLKQMWHQKPLQISGETTVPELLIFHILGGGLMPPC